jgi:hypothetical protein
VALHLEGCLHVEAELRELLGSQDLRRPLGHIQELRRALGQVLLDRAQPARIAVDRAQEVGRPRVVPLGHRQLRL